MRRLLLDDDLPRQLADELARRGRDVLTVRDVGLQAAADAEVLAAAVAEGAVLVTAQDDLPAHRPPGCTVAVVGARARGGDAARREVVHRWAHLMATQRPGSARRYAVEGPRAWIPRP